MFTTAFAIVLSSVGLSASTAALLVSLVTSRRQKEFQKFLNTKVEAESALAFGAARMESAEMMTAHASNAAQAVAMLNERLEGLELVATEQLITRAEVSAAFSELAAIEEQRQRQAAARSAMAPGAMPSSPFTVQSGFQAEVATSPFSTEALPGQIDPWKASDQAAAPVDPAALLREITAMNQRLQGRISAMGSGS
jgi:hypothetical protein